MFKTNTSPRENASFIAIIQRILIGLASAVAVLLLCIALFIIMIRIFFAGSAFPGVDAAGINLEGMTKPEIEVALGGVLTYPNNGQIILSDGDRLWNARPEQLGVVIDAPTMAHEAMAVGRQGNPLKAIKDQFDAWFNAKNIAPRVIFDQRVADVYLRGLAAQIDQTVQEASLSVEGVDVVTVPGRIGRRVDIPAVLEALNVPVAALQDARISLVIRETPPKVMDASEQAKLAREILSQPFILSVEDGEPLILETDELALMLRFDIIDSSDGARYQISIDQDLITDALEEIAPDLDCRPENGRYIFNDDTRELDLLEPAIIGRNLDITGTIEAINQSFEDGAHETALVFDATLPEVGDDVAAADLGITELVSIASTYFNGSGSARVHNITTASAVFHGLLIPPGETLSMAEVLGDITLDNGYAEGLIIYGGHTIKGVGGGVCQVSTTLFRTAFYGGYPIVERHQHAYLVSYYQQGPNSPGPGLDAAVFVPMVDLKFTNDTPSWLLMETYIYGTQLVWKFYSTSDGRVVEISKPEISNKVEPKKPLYKENPDLPKGEIKQVDWEAEGMDVIVYRTVTRNGEVFFEDSVETHYLPWQAVYEYGPGTELPEDALIGE